MLTIEGSQGEGGGQILRTSLELSLVTRQPFRLDHIRARRQKPGLLRQHLTPVEAARTVAGAEAIGTTLGSQTLEFRPGAATPGNEHVTEIFTSFGIRGRSAQEVAQETTAAASAWLAGTQGSSLPRNPGLEVTIPLGLRLFLRSGFSNGTNSRKPATFSPEQMTSWRWRANRWIRGSDDSCDACAVPLVRLVRAMR